MDAAAQEFVPVVILGNLAPTADEVGYAPFPSWLTKKKNYRPSLAAWMVAWDRYAMAADILQQLNFRDSRVHRMHITEVRASANALGCGALILFDRLRSQQVRQDTPNCWVFSMMSSSGAQQRAL